MKNIKKLTLDFSRFEDEATALESDMEHWITYELPEEQGSVSGVFLKTSHDMVFYRGDYTLNQESIGPEFSFGKSNVVFAEDTFVANIILGGMGRFEEQARNSECYPEKQDFIFGQELTHFKNILQYEEDPFFETSEKIVNCVLTIPIRSMALLIGEENTKKLLSFLDVVNVSDTSVHKIPMRITQILQSAVNPHLTGSMKQLYCQAKALEYLCELVELMEKQEVNSILADADQSIITDIHDKLIGYVGRLPTLAELAEQYGLPARTFNSRFKKHYGLSITQYVTQLRMNKAHDIIRNSNVALKIIAADLGYSHVNHFITAFKREFGYPPGSLRK